jgi:hypothetical protein
VQTFLVREPNPLFILWYDRSSAKWFASETERLWRFGLLCADLRVLSSAVMLFWCGRSIYNTAFHIWTVGNPFSVIIGLDPQRRNCAVRRHLVVFSKHSIAGFVGFNLGVEHFILWRTSSFFLCFATIYFFSVDAWRWIRRRVSRRRHFSVRLVWTNFVYGFLGLYVYSFFTLLIKFWEA